MLHQPCIELVEELAEHTWVHAANATGTLETKAFTMGEEPECQLELKGFGPPTSSSIPPGLVLEPLHPLQSLKVVIEDAARDTKLLPEGVIPVGCVRGIEVKPEGGSGRVVLPFPGWAGVGGCVVQLELPGLGMPTTSTLLAVDHLTLLAVQLVAKHPPDDGTGEVMQPMDAHDHLGNAHPLRRRPHPTRPPTSSRLAPLNRPESRV